MLQLAPADFMPALSAGEPRARARVDSALDWHHGNIRRGTAPLCFYRVLGPNMGQKTNDAAADEAEHLLLSALKVCVCRHLISFSACLIAPRCLY